MCINDNSQKLKQSKYLSTDEWISKMVYINTIDYYSGIKRKRVLIHATSWMNLENMLGAGKDWGQEEKGTTEDEMVGWHHWLNGQGFGWTLGVGDGQGGMACCFSWGRKESDTTERLNWTELKDASNKKSYIVWLHLYEISRIGKSLEAQSWFPKTERMEIWWRMTTKWWQYFWWGGGHILQCSKSDRSDGHTTLWI